MKRLALFLSVLLPLAAAAQEVIEVTLREGTNIALALSPDGDVTKSFCSRTSAHRKNESGRFLIARSARGGRMVRFGRPMGGRWRFPRTARSSSYPWVVRGSRLGRPGATST